jgi:hypothetical protein
LGSICCIEPGTKKIIINKGFASNLFNLKIKSPTISFERFWAMYLHGFKGVKRRLKGKAFF